MVHFFLKLFKFAWWWTHQRPVLEAFKLENSHCQSLLKGASQFPGCICCWWDQSQSPILHLCCCSMSNDSCSTSNNCSSQEHHSHCHWDNHLLNLEPSGTERDAMDKDAVCCVREQRESRPPDGVSYVRDKRAVGAWLDLAATFSTSCWLHTA